MTVTIYHRVLRREGFEEAAKTLFNLVRVAQEHKPCEARHLYLDIEGHRNSQGGFDADMLELQQEFVLGFLIEYLSSVHLPLISARNKAEQDNDIPADLLITNQRTTAGLDGENDELKALYIENFDNTEFASEELVYLFLKQMSKLLRKVRLMGIFNYQQEHDQEFDWRPAWRSYLIELITELFNGFILGNLISVSAMTRSLIEAYAYICVFDRADESNLIQRWRAFGFMTLIQHMEGKFKEKGDRLAKQYCDSAGVSFDEVRKQLKQGSNGWLCSVIGSKRVTFRDICNYVGDPLIYDDFKQACSFIHGQDIVTKKDPFTYFSTVYGKLYLMAEYSFKTIALLFPDDDIVLDWIDELYTLLFALGEEYILKQQEYPSWFDED